MKRASEIEVGDEFWHDGTHHYTVEEVYKHPANDLVEVVVRYAVDGGNGVRTFGYEQDVPLTTPDTSG